MKERPGVMFYFSNTPCISQLSDADAGKLMKGYLRYAETGEQPAFDGVLNILWLMLKPTADHDARRYEQQCQQRRYAVYCRQQDRQELPRLSYEQWQTSADNEPYPNTNTNSNSESNSTPTANPNSCCATADFDRPAENALKHFGMSGKVRLTEQDYILLMDELGFREFHEILRDAEAEAAKQGLNIQHLDWKAFLRKLYRQRHAAGRY